MKLMIVNSTFSSDLELVEFLAQSSGIEVISLTDDDLVNMRCARGPEARIQAFQSIYNGKQRYESEIDDANWSVIDNLEHNKTLDLSQ